MAGTRAVHEPGLRGTPAGRHRAALEVRFAGELTFFLSAANREGSLGGIRVGVDGTSSLGHLVQSLGVPLTEVGALMVADRLVDPSYRPAPGDVVDVAPVPRPQSAPTAPPRFLLDVHLGALARRLRLLGVDADYRNPADDDELVAEAASQQRVLLTQDRALLRRRAARPAAYVRGTDPDDQTRDVLDRFRPPLAPFTRCPSCNGVLEAVPKAVVADRLKGGTRRSYDVFSRCLSCGQVYWRGAHARRLDALVASAVPGWGG